MDAFAGLTLLMNTVNKKGKEKEQFSDESPAASALSSIIGLLFGGAAAYLSWTCNTNLNMDTGLKVVYAFLAFLFGFLYLIFYAIFRTGTCG